MVMKKRLVAWKGYGGTGMFGDLKPTLHVRTLSFTFSLFFTLVCPGLGRFTKFDFPSRQSPSLGHS